MKLLGDFFVLQEQVQQGESWTFRIELNPDHFIFQGHFPGFPVLPAAVQFQMVQELMDSVLEEKLRFHGIPRSKFHQMINPLETAVFEWSCSVVKKDEKILVRARARNQFALFSQIWVIYKYE